MSRKKILIVGGGGREHALAWKLAQSEAIASIICIPGNGGTESLSKVHNLPLAVSDFAGIADNAVNEKVDLVIVGPDNPLADGIVDYLQERRINVFGPTRQEAKLEWSKKYGKEVMQALGLPTAKFYATSSQEEALAFLDDPKNDWARVVKADGLALGKGVFVCDSVEECRSAVNSLFAGSFGEAGKTVVIEEKLSGEELSLLCVSDGQTLLELGCAQDHKRRFKADTGPNTGGMGAYTPVPLYENKSVRERIEKEVLLPIQKALADKRLSFKGVLFIGLMIVDGAPYILEFNARFGDPETQAVLARLQSDLWPLFDACDQGTLDQVKLDWSELKSVCVSVVTREYPAKSSAGEKIEIEEGAEVAGQAIIFHAGTKIKQEPGDFPCLVTAGGRVFSVVGLGPTMENARQAAHQAIGKIKFETLDFRNDIGWRAVEQCASK